MAKFTSHSHTYPKNTIIRLNDMALDNYGEQWRDVRFRITHIANKSMPASEFYAKGMPEGYHPGYDNAIPGEPLYDVERIGEGEPFNCSIYGWEVTNRDDLGGILKDVTS